MNLKLGKFVNLTILEAKPNLKENYVYYDCL
jgi:hypothetical protein